MKKIALEINNKIVLALAEKTSQGLWVHVNGLTHFLPEVTNRSSKKQSLQGDVTKIIAPMPGKIMKVLCKKGEVVQSGQTLVVMEAMKMEYNLKAEMNAKVETVICEPGEQVTLGSLLVDLKKQESNK